MHSQHRQAHVQHYTVVFDVKAKFAEKGTEIAELQFSQMQSQLDTFRSNLEDFAAKHKNEIKKNAEFRQHFQQMCARIGVDPLACKHLCLLLQVICLIN